MASIVAVALAATLPLGSAGNLSLGYLPQVDRMREHNQTCADIGEAVCPSSFKLFSQLKELRYNQTRFNASLADELKTRNNTSPSLPRHQLKLGCKDVVEGPPPGGSTRMASATAGATSGPGSLTELKSRHAHTYLMLAIPPHWGSTGLEGLLASSPHVSDMCGAKTWACEGTWLLTYAGVVSSTTRWLPNYTNWTKAFDVYHTRAWNMSRHFLMDKSPPNIAKIPELVDYFEAHGRDYYFITMARHPCFFNQARHEHYYTKAVLLADGLAAIPPARHVHLLYEEAMADPALVTQRILDKIPALEYLDYGINGMAQEQEHAKGEFTDDKKKHTHKVVRKSTTRSTKSDTTKVVETKEKPRIVTAPTLRARAAAPVHAAPVKAATLTRQLAADASGAAEEEKAQEQGPFNGKRGLVEQSASSLSEALDELVVDLAKQQQQQHHQQQQQITDKTKTAGLRDQADVDAPRSQSLWAFASSTSCAFERRSPCYQVHVAHQLGYP